MAVKKSAANAEKNEITATEGNSLSAEENNVNMEQGQLQKGNKGQGEIKLIYIGPSLPKAMLKCNKIFEGTKEDIKKELGEVLEKFPLVERMLVPVAELAEKKDKVRTAGNILNKYYSDLASVASAAGIGEV